MEEEKQIVSEERRSALEATLAAQGAQFGARRGCRVAERYGDVEDEVRAVRQAAGVIDRTDRAFLTASGPDAADYLHRMTSNEVSGLEPGQGRYALQLDAQGHIIADLHLLRMDDHLLLETDWLRREPLREVLTKYIVADDVEIAEASEQLAELQVEGPQSGRLLKAALSQGALPGAELNHAWVRFGETPVLVVKMSETGEEGYRLIFVVEYAQNVWEALAAQRRAAWRPVGHAALNILRTEAGVPWYDADIDERTLPPEASLEQRAISYTKGCYLGQEVIERIRSRGHVNRKLIGLRLSGSELPKAGAKLQAGGKEVGHITTAVHSPTLGAAIALGYVRREHFEPGTRLEVEGGGTAEVAALPLYRRGG
ncbi:MAG: aminomethyltransferase family protein [Candidatus Acidiferrales bacterium]